MSDNERSPKRARVEEESNFTGDTSEPRPKKSKSGSKSSGFKWKTKPTGDTADAEAEKPSKKEKRERKTVLAEEEPRSVTASAPPATEPAQPSEEDDVAAKFGSSYKRPSTTTAVPSTSTSTSVAADMPAPKPAKSSKTKSAPAPTGPMIIVKINDRLGTTSRVPCLPSDTVGDFKKLVAMRIGRKPHEIMLKRQSERPFKDFLTLEDYGVSDGVQLDLELDTGD